MLLLPALRKALVGSICTHNQGRCVLLSPGKRRIFAVDNIHAEASSLRDKKEVMVILILPFVRQSTSVQTGAVPASSVGASHQHRHLP